MAVIFLKFYEIFLDAALEILYNISVTLKANEHYII